MALKEICLRPTELVVLGLFDHFFANNINFFPKKDSGYHLVKPSTIEYGILRRESQRMQSDDNDSKKKNNVSFFLNFFFLDRISKRPELPISTSVNQFTLRSTPFSEFVGESWFYPTYCIGPNLAYSHLFSLTENAAEQLLVASEIGAFVVRPSEHPNALLALSYQTREGVVRHEALSRYIIVVALPIFKSFHCSRRDGWCLNGAPPYHDNLETLILSNRPVSKELAAKARLAQRSSFVFLALFTFLLQSIESC